MSTKNYDVSIAFRTYASSKSSKPRPIYRDNKFKMIETCVKSLKSSLGSLKVKFYALLDNCPLKWDKLFQNIFNKEDLEIIHLNKAGEIGSIKYAMNLLIKQKYSDVVYMAEEDYFYLPNQFEKMIKFIQDPDVDFITPYDHLDYYRYDLHDYSSKIKILSEKHWRNVSTTCNTYLTTRKTLYKTKDNFLQNYLTYNRFSRDIFKKNKMLRRILHDFYSIPRDSDVWLSLTKINVFKLFKMIKYRIQNRPIFDYFFRAWRFNWRQILFGKKWNLWCPMPSIATHLESAFLAPTIDWKYLFVKYKEENQS